MDDWTKCVQWLVRVGMLPGDHRLATPAAQLAELAYLLRDGVLLCRLLNRLRPRTINTKDFSQRPQTSQFLCMKNANVFLNRCKTVFKMRDSDLFPPEILYSMESFGDVLKTLSILSNTAEAQKSNLPPFTLQNSSNFNNNNSIKDYINCTINDDDYMYDYVRLDEDEDDVYGTLMDFQKSQSSNSPTLSNGNREHPKEVKEMVKSKRDHCIDEMVETERKYVEALEMIVKVLLRFLDILNDSWRVLI
jgi:guanine nucleotide exchange factor VAV